MKNSSNKQRKHHKKKGIRVKRNQRTLLPEGIRTMTCVAIKEKVKTRFNVKDYLYWKDAETDQILTQYFNRPQKKYSQDNKAVHNYMVAMNRNDFTRIDLSELVRLRAKVTCEVVRPKWSKGIMKGQVKPEIFHYSKVGEIVKPLGWSKKEIK